MKACPFCFGVDKRYGFRIRACVTTIAVECAECGFHGPEAPLNDDGAAIRAAALWNASLHASPVTSALQ